MKVRGLLLLGLVAGLAGPARGDPIPIGVAGRLESGTGTPIETTSDVEFGVFPPGGGSNHLETIGITSRADGLFVARVGAAGTPLDPDVFRRPVSLELFSNNPPFDGLVGPAYELQAVPYALASASSVGLAGRRVFVPGDGSSSENGAALLAAYAALAPTSLNASYELVLGPGDYDLGTAALPLKQNANIQGSGRDRTRILGSGCELALADQIGEVRLRDLTVQSTSPTSSCAALTLRDGDLVELWDARIQAVTGAAAVRYEGDYAELEALDSVIESLGAGPAIFNSIEGSSLTKLEGTLVRRTGPGDAVVLSSDAEVYARDSELTAESGRALYVEDSAEVREFVNCVLTGTIAYEGTSETLEFVSCVLQGTGGSAVLLQASGTMELTRSRVEGTLTCPGGGSIRGRANHDGNGSAVSRSCP